MPDFGQLFALGLRSDRRSSTNRVMIFGGSAVRHFLDVHAAFGGKQ